MKRFATILSFIFFISSLSNAECTFKTFSIGEDFDIGNMLIWITAEEEGNAKFLIEKSTDGVEYEEIGEVPSTGDSHEEQEYRFMDFNARQGRTLYRIKQTDFDGESSYSQTVIVDKETPNNFMIVAMKMDDSHSHIRVSIDAIVEGEIKYTIADKSGDILIEDTHPTINGLNDINFDLLDFPDGVYRLWMSSGEEKEELVFKKTTPAEQQKVPVASKN